MHSSFQVSCYSCSTVTRRPLTATKSQSLTWASERDSQVRTDAFVFPTLATLCECSVDIILKFLDVQRVDRNVLGLNTNCVCFVWFAMLLRSALENERSAIQVVHGAFRYSIVELTTCCASSRSRRLRYTKDEGMVVERNVAFRFVGLIFVDFRDTYPAAWYLCMTVYLRSDVAYARTGQWAQGKVDG